MISSDESLSNNILKTNTLLDRKKYLLLFCIKLLHDSGKVPRILKICIFIPILVLFNYRNAIVKDLFFIGSTRKDSKNLPEEVKSVVGYALYLAQNGERPPKSKILKGFGGGGVLEVVEDFNRDTYRAVYTVKFKFAVYLLHVFKKKSKQGIATPKKDLELLRERLIRAERHYKERVI